MRLFGGDNRVRTNLKEKINSPTRSSSNSVTQPCESKRKSGPTIIQLFTYIITSI